MQTLKQYVNDGQLSLGKLDQNNQIKGIAYEQLLQCKNNQEKNVRVMTSIQNLTWDQKYQWVTYRKLKGNQMYKEVYLESLLGVELKEGTQQQKSQMTNELKLPLVLNIATCLYKKHQHKKSLLLCDTILNENPKYLIAIYKKINLQIKLGDFNEAKKLIDIGIGIARQQNQPVNYFKQLKVQLMKMYNRNRNIYRKMFNNNSVNNGSCLVEDKQNCQERNDEDGDGDGDDGEILQYRETICQQLYKIASNLFGVVQSFAASFQRQKNQQILPILKEL